MPGRNAASQQSGTWTVFPAGTVFPSQQNAKSLPPDLLKTTKYGRKPWRLKKNTSECNPRTDY
jgi:hypothetical protein